MPTGAADIERVVRDLERWGAARDWLGPDPYEGLNSPLGRFAPGRRGRQAVIQAYRRLPIAPPPPLRAKPRRNAKAVALLVSAYATPAAGERFGERAGRQVASGIALLRELNLLNPPKAAWGYHFDFQSRWGRYGAAQPNAIATCFAIGALLDAGETELALSARPFLADELWQDVPDGAYFGYIGESSALIHNASAMICGALARLHEVEPDDEIADRVRRAAATTSRLQRSDGAWPYGEGGNLGWVDNFHTGYTLEGLYEVERVLGGDQTIATALDAGYRYWLDNLFEDDGRARARDSKLYPLEAHSYATAVDTLVVIRSRFPDALDQAGRIAQAAVRDMWLPDRNYFAFERWEKWTNKRAFIRWTNAPMLRALLRLLSARTSS